MAISSAAVQVEDLAVLVSEESLDSAIDSRRGWCPSCADFTTPGVALSDKGVACADCGDDRVCGAVHARRNGFISVKS